MKSILVTGGAGYVGSIVLRKLLSDEYSVVCVDNLTFGGESLLEIMNHPNFSFIKRDITNHDAMDSIFKSRDYFGLVHLAAIVGDPACKAQSDLAVKINREASMFLMERAIKHGIQRFVFASTCSNYGKMSDQSSYVDEDSPLAPISLYASLKVEFENTLINQKRRERFFPTSLRFATVYGISPRMRFDLTVNEFAKELALGRDLTIFGEQFWRPYCHVNDFSRAISTVLEAVPSEVGYNVFNVGSTEENYTKKMILDLLTKELPESRINYAHKEEDPRDYRVNCDKIKKALGFSISRRVPEGIREVIEVVRQGIISNPDDQRFYNIERQ